MKNNETRDALQAIYEYMLEAELSHYEEASKVEKKKHIFKFVQVLGTLLGYPIIK